MGDFRIIMNKDKRIVELTQYYSGSFYYKGTTPQPARLSVTKLLGGKSNVVTSRYWTHHGGGNWIVEWRVKNLEKAKKAILDSGYGYMITKGMEILEQK